MGFRKPYNRDLLEEVIFTEETQTLPNWKKIFNNKNPLIVEMGCGNGHFLTSKAIENKDLNYIGIDLKRNRMNRCREKQVKHNIENIAWICGEALQSLKTLFKNNSIKEVYMPFPDPWPKRRHHKHRMFNNDLVKLLRLKLKKKGKFIFITDYKEYFQANIKLIDNDKRFKLIVIDDANQLEFGISLFGEKWKKDNRDFFAFELIKK